MPKNNINGNNVKGNALECYRSENMFSANSKQRKRRSQTIASTGSTCEQQKHKNFRSVESNRKNRYSTWKITSDRSTLWSRKQRKNESIDERFFGATKEIARKVTLIGDRTITQSSPQKKTECRNRGSKMTCKW